MTTETKYEPLIEKAISLYEKWIEQAKASNGHARILRQIEEQFPEIFYHASATAGMEISVKVSDSKQIVAVLRWLRGHGYKSVGFEDNQGTQRRKYRICKAGQEKKYGADFHLIAYFNTQEGTCKYVEVGKKTIPAREEQEIPIMELRCGDDAVPEV